MHTIAVAKIVNSRIRDFWNLPVTPTSITISDPNDVRRDVIVNFGEVTDIGIGKPSQISFSSFFPVFDDTFTIGAVNPNGTMITTPDEWITRFKSLKQKIILLNIMGMNISGKYIMADDFTYRSIGGTGGDIDYTVSFLEHKPVSIRSASPGSENILLIDNRENYGLEETQVYLVRENDTWSSIANKFKVNTIDLAKHNRVSNLYALKSKMSLSIPSASNLLVYDLGLDELLV